jgi:zinc transport system substrate-binding protein
MTRARLLKYFILVILGFCSSSFLRESVAAAQKPRIKIIASIFPLMEFAGEVAAERGEVSLLLPPGAGVHTWQPRASDIMRLAAADLFIYVGAGLEPWIPDLLKSISPQKFKILAVADFLPLEEKKESGQEEDDPHVWLDFGLDRMIVSRVAETLSEIDPAGASLFRRNAATYNEKLRKLDEHFSQSLGQCRHRTFLLAGHAAFGYLARRYHLVQLSLYGLSPDAEPTPRRLLDTIVWARGHTIKTVYMEANTSDRMAKVLAREIQAGILVLNPGANLNKKEWDSGLTFFDIMEENLKNLKKGLICD